MRRTAVRKTTILMAVVSPALSAILDAHGGLDRWREVSRIDVEMSARGFLFRAKGVPYQRHAHLSIDTRSPWTVIHDYPAAGLSGILQGANRVEIRDADGNAVAVRDPARSEFDPRPWKHWDALNFAYFSGYAMWNYLTLPFLLLAPGVEVQPVSERRATVLDVRFPSDIPTHSEFQRLYFDGTGRLYRHDYTAEVVGGWARAIHLCSNYREFNGLWFPRTRRVYPRGLFGRPLPAPTLVAIDIHHLNLS